MSERQYSLLLFFVCASLVFCSLVCAGDDKREAQSSNAAGEIPRDYYEILGVERSATIQEIKAAYRRLSLKWHPDRNPGATEEASKRFIAISRAYEVLSDPQKRARYDKFGPEDENGSTVMEEFDPEKFADLFKHAFDMFAEAFGNAGDLFEGMKVKVKMGDDSDSDDDNDDGTKTFKFDGFEGDINDIFGNIAQELKKAKQEQETMNQNGNSKANTESDTQKQKNEDGKKASRNSKMKDGNEDDEYVYFQSPDFEGMKFKRKVTALFDGTPVKVLTRSNMDKELHGNGDNFGDNMWLVLFYHRVAWEQASEFSRSYITLAKSLRDIALLGAVDCASPGGQPLCNKYDITDYPTFLLFNYDNVPPIKYTQSSSNKGKTISIKDLDSWVIKQIPDRVHFVTESNIRDFMEKTTPFVRALLFTKRSQPNALVKTIAMKLRGKAVVAIINPSQKSLLNEFGVTKIPTLVALFSGTDMSRYNVYQGENTFADITKYLLALYEFDTEKLDNVDTAEFREAAEFMKSIDDVKEARSFEANEKSEWKRENNDNGHQKNDDAIVPPPVQELTRSNFEDALLSIRTAMIYFTPGGKVTPSTREFLRNLAKKYVKSNIWIFWADGTKMRRFHDHFPQPSNGAKVPGEVLFIVPSSNKFFWAEQQLENIDATFDRWIDGDARWTRYEVLPSMKDLYN